MAATVPQSVPSLPQQTPHHTVPLPNRATHLEHLPQHFDANNLQIQYYPAPLPTPTPTPTAKVPSHTVLQLQDPPGTVSVKTSRPWGTYLRRLLQEDPNVEGNGWFAKNPEDPGHIFANVLRFVCLLAIAPLYVLSLDIILMDKAVKENARGVPWSTGPLAPAAVLRHPPAAKDNQQTGGYQPTDFLPRWLLKITIRNGHLTKEQISYEEARKMEDFHCQGYTALSYWIESANELLKLITGSAIPKMDGNRKYELRDRQRMAMVYLEEYFYAHWQRLKRDNCVEFVWLDEFCLSDERQPLELQMDQRKVELGRLADIFRGAAKVGVFCHRYGCDHTTQECGWSTRLFTLPEILHTKTVEVMIMQESREPQAGTTVPYAFVIESMSGDAFRRKMLQSAAEEGKWHLWGLMHSAVNAGSVPWQVAIHSLVVEAVRRDIESEFPNHEFLGKGLNGLLPRRAKPEDLKGKNGWSDLTWLLELNQGFYNAASLAAICNLGTERSWIGPPIDVTAGSERLEPLATAFPVGRATSGDVPPLAVVGAQIIDLKPRFKRDSFALYNRGDDLKKTWTVVRIFAIAGILFAGTIGATGNISVQAATALLWISAIAFMLLHLIVGTMYLKGDQVFIDTEREGDPVNMLRTLDARWHGKDPLEWGNEQMIPRWDEDKGDRIRGAFIDVHFGVITRAIVTTKPNALAVLAIHGSGVTSMLIEKQDTHPSQANKVGMCNLPPYCLYLTEQAGSITVKG